MYLRKIMNTNKKGHFKKIRLNSKDIKKGDLFIPFSGIEDRNKYILDAINKKCSFIITNNNYNHEKVIKVNNLEKEVINIFNKYYNYPLKNISLIGVTGTDGKTTITSILSDLLNCPTIGTNGFNIKNKNYSLNNTTPSLDVLYDCFNKTRNKKYKNLVMEVSSESYLTNRIGKLKFEIGICTNITKEHLDKHKSFNNYLKCKMELFKNSKISILNHDSKYYQKLKNVSKKTYSYGFSKGSTLRILYYKLYEDRSLICFKYLNKKYKITYNLLGKFNVYNIACCILTMSKLGYNMDFIIERIKFIKGIKGRMELIYNKKFKVILDYAHTTNATLNVLKFFSKYKRNIITVVGCAGFRYKEKRKEIGDIVLKYSKLGIFTSDDPRFENPDEIIDDMLKITNKNNYIRIINRYYAIEYALKIANKDDIILILGKGHDNYMVVNHEKIPYSDMRTINEIIKKLKL